MEATVNQILDKLNSIDQKILDNDIELLKFKRQLHQIKLSEKYKGYGGKVIINISEEHWNLINSLIIKGS